MPKLSLTRHLIALSAGACLLLGAGAGAAQAATAGILPPRNPASDCDRSSTASASWGLAGIDACRALEGVGPLTLPSNWNALTPVEQGFVLIDLERVNRGLPPIVGLSASLDQLASAGAASGDDPSFPSGGFIGGGAVWAGAGSVLAADYMWMYDDGPNGLDTNLACPSAGASGCWGHRDIILWNRDGGPLVAGGGHASGSDGGSYAYLVLAGYSTSDLTFTWAGELSHFKVKPGVERTGKVARATKRSKHKVTKHRKSSRKPAKRGGSGSGITISFG